MRKLTLSLAVLAALMPGRGYPLGLGEIELNSALNQELDAEIEVLSAVVEDAEQLIVKLASREAFARAGIDRPYILQDLKFKVIVKNNKPYVRVFTKTAVREPFISFLVEIDWPEGHLLREYTLLLDPPVYSRGSAAAPATDTGRPFIDPADLEKTQPAQTDSMMQGRPAQAAYQQSQPMQATQQATRPVMITSPVTGRQVTYQVMPQHAEVSGNYRVQQNDTLWGIASRTKPDNSISVDQMMLALVRKNPEAFINENINGVKRGYILRMPDRAEITAIDRQTALAQARQHSALWREYRQTMSGAVPASSMEAEQTGQADSMAEDAAEGKLSIVSASDTGGSETAASGQDPRAQLKNLRQELSLARESLESERLEKTELKARLAELEQRVQGVLSMDDGELAKLQSDLKGVKQAVTEEVADEQPVEEALPEEALLVEEPPVEEEPVVDETATEIEAAAIGIPAKDAVFVDETTTGTAQEPVEEEAPYAVTPKQQAPAAVPDFIQPAPKNFFEQLLEDQTMLAAVGGALVAVLAGIAALLRRRRKKQAEDVDWEELGDSSTSLEDIDTEATIQTTAVNVDDTAEVPLSDFDDADSDDQGDFEDTVYSLDEKPAEVEPEQQDDVLAEADVYLAYGIYQQAEELLKNAINANSDRDDYRMKLLETYYAAKNNDAFASLAEEVHGRKSADKRYWDRVATMGLELCPNHKLFSSADVNALLDIEIPQKPEAPDLELDAGGDEFAADFDLGFGEEEANADATQLLSEPLDLSAMESAVDEAAMDELDLSAELASFGSDLEMDAAAEKVAETSDAEEELAFDLGDFDAELEETSDSSMDDDSALDIEDDFSLDFEASDLGFEIETDEESTEEELHDASADLNLSMDTGLAEEPETGAEIELDMPMEIDDSELSLESEIAEDDMAELDMEIPDELEAELDVEIPDELEAELDMEIPEKLEAEPGLDDAAELDMSAMLSDDDFDFSELSEDIDEVGTKLDLAKAYIDMGDKDGALSILEEVKQEGNAAQQQEAAELIQKAG